MVNLDSAEQISGLHYDGLTDTYFALFRDEQGKFWIIDQQVKSLDKGPYDSLPDAYADQTNRNRAGLVKKHLLERRP